MSFWTGFTTGLASSVDRGLQKAVEKRDGELSRAKDFWMQRKATKLEAAEAEKLEFDKKAEKAYGRLADELGDANLAYAAYQKLGGPDEVLGYLDKVNEARGKLQPGQTYNISDDFVGYQAGKTTLTRAEAMERVRMPMPSLGTVSASDLAIDDKLGRLFGREGVAAETAAESINKRFSEFQGSGTAAAPIDVGTIGSVDLTRQVAAQEAGRDKTRFEREGKLFDVELDAKKTNTQKLEQAMEIAKTVEERAAAQFIIGDEQRQLENARAEVADLQTQAKLIQDAEAHVKNMRAKDLTIEKTEMDIAKEKDHPVFKSFEDMAVYASQKIAAGKFTADKPKEAYERMYKDAIDGALKYTAATAGPETGVGSVEFAKQSLDSIVEAARKLELEKVPQKAIGDKVKYTIDGNEAAYYGGMDRALNTVTERLTGTDGKIAPQAQRYIASLKADNTQKAYGFASSRAAEYNTAVANNESTAQINYVPWNVVSGLQNSQGLKKYARENIKKGAVVPLKEDGSLYGIWTGTKFVKAQDMDR